MVKTFKNIIEDIQTFCGEHLQINDFGWGQISNISTKEHDFVMVFLQPVKTSVEGRLVTMGFDMYVFDLVKQDKNNLIDVLNDTLLIGNDIVARFWDDEELYEWTLNENNVEAEPFDAKWDDFCSGWIFSIEIEIENRLNLCSVPKN